MATITKRGPRQWQAKIRKRGYQTVSKTFSTKARAARWATGIEADMEAKVFVDSSPAEATSFDDLAERYMAEVLIHQRSTQEAPFRLNRLRQAFGEYGPTAISPLLVSNYKDRRLGEVSPASVRKELLLLRRVLERARKEWGLHLPHGNPVSSIRLPQDSRSRDRRLQGDEEQRLLSAATYYGGEIANAIVFAIETAARRAEIANLRWEDVSLAKRTAVFRDTKNGETRTIPLSTTAREVLCGQPRQITGRVFRIKAASISQAFRRICRSANIENLRFHDLRQEATSRLFERGLSIMEVASITGHTDLKMLRRYTHLLSVVKRMEQL